MKATVLDTKKYTIYIDGADITFELKSTGESFTLYCEAQFCPYTERLMKIIPYDYDGCFDFNRAEVKSILNGLGIEVDYSEL